MKTNRTIDELPVIIKLLMLINQNAQSSEINLSVFRKYNCPGKEHKGFNFSESFENKNICFWGNISANCDIIENDEDFYKSCSEELLKVYSKDELIKLYIHYLIPSTFNELHELGVCLEEVFNKFYFNTDLCKVCLNGFHHADYLQDVLDGFSYMGYSPFKVEIQESEKIRRDIQSLKQKSKSTELDYPSCGGIITQDGLLNCMEEKAPVELKLSKRKKATLFVKFYNSKI